MGLLCVPIIVLPRMTCTHRWLWATRPACGGQIQTEEGAAGQLEKGGAS